jgi:hypothetical protein
MDPNLLEGEVVNASDVEVINASDVVVAVSESTPLGGLVGRLR